MAAQPEEESPQKKKHKHAKRSKTPQKSPGSGGEESPEPASPEDLSKAITNLQEQTMQNQAARTALLERQAKAEEDRLAREEARRDAENARSASLQEAQLAQSSAIQALLDVSKRNGEQ